MLKKEIENGVKVFMKFNFFFRGDCLIMAVILFSPDLLGYVHSAGLNAEFRFFCKIRNLAWMFTLHFDVMLYSFSTSILKLLCNHSQ